MDAVDETLFRLSAIEQEIRIGQTSLEDVTWAINEAAQWAIACEKLVAFLHSQGFTDADIKEILKTPVTKNTLQ